MKTFRQFIKEEGPPITTHVTKSGIKYHVHGDHAHKFKSMVDELENSGYKIKSISSYRPGATVAGSGNRSAHADAMAIDINPGQNPHTFPHHNNYGQTDMPDIVTKDKLHKKYGLGWGGEWKNSKDTMHFSAHPREGADPNWQPATNPDSTTKPEEPKQQKVSPTPMAPKDMSFAQQTEPKAAEPTKAEPQSSAGKSWSQVRADAGFSARQSVTSDPKLLDLYNKYKEGNLNENFEQFVKKKYKKKDEHLDEDLQKIKNSAKLAAAEFHKNMVDYYGHPYDITGTPTEIASAVAAGTLGPTAHKLAKKAKPIAKKVAIKVLRKMRNK